MDKKNSDNEHSFVSRLCPKFTGICAQSLKLMGRIYHTCKYDEKGQTAVQTDT